eukprot:s2104_g1.t1
MSVCILHCGHILLVSCHVSLEEKHGAKKSPEFRVANRHVPIPEDEDVGAMAKRVLSKFETPFQVLRFSDEGSRLFTAFQAGFNTQAAVLRDSEDGSARQGTAAWHLAVLSASMLVLDIGLGVRGQAASLEVGADHVCRAFNQLKLSHDVVGLWTEKVPATTTWTRGDTSDAALQMSSRARLDAVCDTAIPHSQFETFRPEGQGPVEVQESQDEPPKVLGLLDPEIPPLTHGYGPNGESVQSPDDGEIILSDRAIMAKTILRGEPIIFGHKVIDSVSIKKKNPDTQKYSRVSLKLRHWKAVVSAGLNVHRVGRFDDGQACTDHPRQPRLILELPPAGDEAKRVEYHNRLMLLCGVPYSSLVSKIEEKVQVGTARCVKSKAKKPAEKEPEQAPAGKRLKPKEEVAEESQAGDKTFGYGNC